MNTTGVDINVKALDGVPEEQADRVREKLEPLVRAIGDRPATVELALRPGNGRGPDRFVVDGRVSIDGRTAAAHTAGPDVVTAADEAVDRLRRQVRRVFDSDVALRNEPRTIRAALESLPFSTDNRPRAAVKGPELRDIVRERTYATEPRSTLSAIADLLDDDLEFLLFVHVRTNEDAVVHHRDDGRFGLLFQPPSVLADEDDLVVPERSRYDDPLTLAAARAEMDMLDHRWLFFIDAADMRGKVLYLRHDGDYGLVVPE